MDERDDTTAVLPSERSSDPLGNVVLEVAGHVVRNLVLTPERIKEIWEKLQKVPGIFSDQTFGDFELFCRIITSPDSVWLTIDDDGLFYATNIIEDVNLYIHAVFFDRDVATKDDIIREILKQLFIDTGVHRMSADIPAAFFATKRLLNRLGFKCEGVRREIFTQRGKWQDMILFGISRVEAKRKWDF